LKEKEEKNNLETPTFCPKIGGHYRPPILTSFLKYHCRHCPMDAILLEQRVKGKYGVRNLFMSELLNYYLTRANVPSTATKLRNVAPLRG
jgi:hypothetical protein